MRLKISARKSDLARLQAYRVAEALTQKHPHIQVEFLFKESLGDKNLTDPLWQIPEKGVFTEDFYAELVSGKTDMVVHSWKDLPTELKPDTFIAATLARADQRDLLLLKKSDFARIRESKKLRLFSSSPRRAYNLAPFLKSALPFSLGDTVEFESVRGNIPTRIRKLLESKEVSGLIVAKAALDRLLSAPEKEFLPVQQELRQSLQQLEWMVLPLSVNPNAAAQGALAIEIHQSRSDLKEILRSINDETCFQSVQQERAVLGQHGGGCHQKIGVAVLPRKYGNVQICRGQTDAGLKLNQYEILKSAERRFHENEMWQSSSESFFNSENIPGVVLPKNINAILVAKAQAWPKDLAFKGIVWSAGIATWKKLAAQGVWVHGSQDGLGEQEETQVETLAQRPLSWAKLTHESGVRRETVLTIATYRLLPRKEAASLRSEWKSKKSFFWSSGSQFLRALEIEPDLADRHHACGPGNTYQIISEKISQVEIFLNQEEWKQKCQM